MSWWCVDVVTHFLVDPDTVIGDNKHTVEVSDTSLRKVDPIDGTKEKIHRLCTDAVGGGTREGLDKELSLVDRTISLMDFMTNTRGHHGMNRMMQIPCEKHFGDGRVLNRNLIKLIFTCCPIQDKYEMSEWRATW